jgi:hypothetical protein
MRAVAVVCPRCQNPLPGALCNLGVPASCPACRAVVQVEVFPAFFRSPRSTGAAEPILEEGLASCFYHEKKKAVVPCDSCGRFLCALCDLDFGGRHLCPACLQSGKRQGNLPDLQNRRTLYDSAALSLSLITLLVLPAAIVTGPLTVYLAVLSWIRPASLVPRTHVRAYVALVLAALELAWWVWFASRFNLLGA